MDSNRFEWLLDRYLGGTATAPEAADLEGLLKADANLRRQLTDRLLLEVQLHKAFAGIAPSAVVEPQRRRVLASVNGWLVAAVVLVGVGIGLVAWKSQQGPAVAIAANEVLAGEVRVDGVAIKQIPEERWFDVAAEAPAVIRLVDGSEAELAPASRAMLHGRRESVREAVELQRGAGKFKITSGGGQFRVETSLGNVTVLGTEFTAKLESRSRGEGKRSTKTRNTLTVAVAEGSVKVDSAGKSYVLAAGERRTFYEGGKKEEDEDRMERERERERD
ncbi:hypothetical protein AYO44_10025 [Planctomycetaceae bacterium SCGC AG-212-F19]|nr:hypothetical protein AYO44_10025 [Planctomycetaceae bacterium SCGC AG-212-F19]